MRRTFFSLLLLALPAAAAAQSSQFGARGLGYPGSGVSTRSAGSAGAFGLFDSESSLNPAALGGIQVVTAGFTGVQGFRTVDNPIGSASLRESRFPLVTIAGPVRRLPLALGVSYSLYADRDFSLASSDTLDLRGVPVPVFDTLSSRGGISDLRVAAAYGRGRTTVGGSFHILTGSNRLQSRRTFEDDNYLPVAQSAELSYAGVGGSLGVIHRLGGRFTVAAIARSDGHVSIDRDSTPVSRTDLPYTFGLGLLWQASPKLALAGRGIFRTWSGANSDLLAQGAPGSDNTVDLALGGEYVGDPKRPYRRPLRIGVRYANLPFPLETGVQPTEFAVSIGTGTRFAQQRGGVDLALEHVWRSAGDFKERSLLVSVGVSVRP